MYLLSAKSCDIKTSVMHWVKTGSFVKFPGGHYPELGCKFAENGCHQSS